MKIFFFRSRGFGRKPVKSFCFLEFDLVNPDLCPSLICQIPSLIHFGHGWKNETGWPCDMHGPCRPGFDRVVAPTGPPSVVKRRVVTENTTGGSNESRCMPLHSYLAVRRRSSGKSPIASSIKPPRITGSSEYGSGTEDCAAGYEKFLYQTKKSSPSTSST